MYFPCQIKANHTITAGSKQPNHRVLQERGSHPLFGLHDDGLLVLLRHQHAGGEGGFDHVDDQVVGQDVQLLHLVARHVGAAGNAVPSRRGKRSKDYNILPVNYYLDL